MDVGSRSSWSRIRVDVGRSSFVGISNAGVSPPVSPLHVTVAIIQQSIAEINMNGDEELKTTAVRALWMLHKMRVKLGEYLLERVNDPAFADRISACMNGSATAQEKKTVVEMHRCRLHVQSREFSSSHYMFDTFTYGRLRKDFDRLYAAVTGARKTSSSRILRIVCALRSSLRSQDR